MNFSERKRTVDNVIALINAKWNNHVTMDVQSYVNVSTVIRFTDDRFGEWFSCPKSVYNGVGHPRTTFEKKSISHKLVMSEILSRIESTHNGKVVLDESTFKTPYVKARFVDFEHGGQHLETFGRAGDTQFEIFNKNQKV